MSTTLDIKIKKLIYLALFTWVFLSLITSETVTYHQLDRALALPSFKHPFGFDAFGRDLFWLSLFSSFKSMLYTTLCVSVAVLVSLIASPLCILFKNPISQITVKSNNLVLAFPGIVMSLVLASVLGASQASMMISIIIATVPITFRLIYLRSQELHHEDYVQASIALGCKPIPLIFKHFVPALWDTCRVKIPNLIASGILAEAAISFLGAGAPSGTDTWGSLLAQGRSYMLEAPHIMLSTGLPLVAVLLCLNYLYKS